MTPTCISNRSWTIPFVLLLYRVHGGLVPRLHMATALAWAWAAAALLAAPPFVAREALLDAATCSLNTGQGNTAMVVYVAVVTFLLPACVLTPVFVKWSRQDIEPAMFPLLGLIHK